MRRIKYRPRPRTRKPTDTESASGGTPDTYLRPATRDQPQAARNDLPGGGLAFANCRRSQSLRDDCLLL